MKNKKRPSILEQLKGVEINPLVGTAIGVVNNASTIDQGNVGIDFTHYLEVEKELRKVNYKVEEHPELIALYNELMLTVKLFSHTEYLREINLNSILEKNASDFYQIDSCSRKDFFFIMKKIITLQALVGNKLNPKYKAIVDEVFEDFINIIDEALENGAEYLQDPVKFYQKEVQKCL